ncbi:response regulator transcription factor [Cnuibacter physcomitrellae]|uniref:response regulator transcription factor n=1 Tax=Cnuibacter physcomitrellae TaxID=1619308 RepID=UPI0021759482|nr:response regulator transcription factor [Cnuibacter physcomitrellae]MCS5497077.1 response regulator transcription factor [Cnuibacter physcomitrellae]
MREQLGVVVADDDPLVRRVVVHHLEASRHVHVLAECEDGEQAIHAARLYRVDAVVADVWMKGVNGIAATTAIRRVCADTRVILMTRTVDSRVEQAARLAGAEAVLDKSRVIDDLLPLLTGESEPASRRSELVMLSARERQVAQLLIAGRTNADIGLALGLSINSVKTYASRIYTKLQVTNRVQLAHSLTAPHSDRSVEGAWPV